MSMVLIIVISILVMAGILLLLSRDVFKMVMGLAVLGAATNLVVFSGGRPGSLVPAIIEQGNTMLNATAASPLPQALVLTAIVIGFALFCFSLILAIAIVTQQGTADIATYQANEPSHKDGQSRDKPMVIEVKS